MAKTDDLHAILPLIQRFLGPNPDALEQMRVQVQSEVDSYEKAAKQARAQLAAIDQLIEGMKKADAIDGGAAAVPVNAPPLRRAIKIILGERTPDRLTRDEIVAELARRRWSPGGKTPRNTVVSRLSELVRDGQVERRGDQYGLATVQTEGGT